MDDRQIRHQALLDALNSRVLVLDGAMGTMLYERHLTLADYGGPQFENCHENLVFTKPDVIRDIHRAYFAAGADMVETDTFGGMPLVLAEFGIAHLAHEQNIAAARLAREAAEEFSTPGRPRFVAGSMGPTTKAISVSGGITFRELIETYAAQAEALMEGGVDVLLLETSNDTRTVKAALLGIDGAAKENRLPDSCDGVWHYRTLRHHARGANRGCVLHFYFACRSALCRLELRNRSGVHDRPHPLDT